MNARQAAQVERWAREDAAARGELVADGDPCQLCGRPTRKWSDLCDDCDDALLELARGLAARR